MLQFGSSLTDDARSVNYDRNTLIIQAIGVNCAKSGVSVKIATTGIRKLFWSFFDEILSES